MEPQEIYMIEAECTLDNIKNPESFILPEHIAASRRENAHRIAKKINWLRKSHLVFNEDNDLVTEDFTIDSRGYVRLGCVSYFVNDTELDNGMYTTIEEYNKQFENWTIIPKSERIKLVI